MLFTASSTQSSPSSSSDASSVAWWDACDECIGENHRQCSLMTTRLFSLRQILTIIMATGPAACSNAVGPAPPRGERLFAIGGEGTSIFVVDPATGRVVARPGPVPFFETSPLLFADGSMLFFVDADQTGTAIFALDASRLRLQRCLDIDSPARAPYSH
jgi:hypothetical protein